VLAAGEPAISVDTKKKELAGDFRNGGCEWRPQGSPERVRVHDFVIPELGRGVPCGVYEYRCQLHPKLVEAHGPCAIPTPAAC